MQVLVCIEWEPETETCAVQEWVPWPGVIPPLPAEQGLQVAMAMWGVVGLAWGFKFLRRFVSPRTG